MHHTPYSQQCKPAIFSRGKLRAAARGLIVVLCFFFAWRSDTAQFANARPALSKKRPTMMKAVALGPTRPASPDGPYRASTPPTIIQEWTFPSCQSQGWVTRDRTVARSDDYFHVDDFAGLNGGTFHQLSPIKGSKSLWCGARSSSSNDELCSYQYLPGYGDNWRQSFCTPNCLTVTGNVTVTYKIKFDLEPAYDFVIPQYSLCDDHWEDAEPTFFTDYGHYNIKTTTIASSKHSGQIQLRFFVYTDVAGSDEDGTWNSDGAVVLDSLTVRDASGIKLPTENFETEAVGATSTASGNWSNCNEFGYGTYAALFNPSIYIPQEDPCTQNLSCFWGFFEGSAEYYSCGNPPAPATKIVPHLNTSGQYIANEIWSPPIDIDGDGSGVLLQFDVYRDLPLDNLVAYTWEVRSFSNGCPGPWVSDITAYFGDAKDWFQHTVDLSPFIDPSADEIQVALGVRDMCRLWCGTQGTGSCHSHAPLFDNVRIIRADRAGPQWFVPVAGLFQDSFPGNGTVTGTVRADCALDTNPPDNPNVRAGDSTFVFVEDPVHGLAEDSYVGGSAAVYLYVHVTPSGQPTKTGAGISGDATRYRYAGTQTISGDVWTRIRADSVRWSSGVVPRAYCVDLNDNLFTPGDTVNFFLGAKNTVNEFSYWCEDIAVTSTIQDAASHPMEFTCLPTIAPGGHGILYIDDSDGGGTQAYFDQAFGMLGLDGHVDRYDVRAPASVLGNGPQQRVSSYYDQVLPYYRTIIWSSEGLSGGRIGDGVTDKSNDYQFLYTFLDNLEHPGGVWLSGDNIAEDMLMSNTYNAISLRSRFINYSLTNSNHRLQGLGLNPFVVGIANGVFASGSQPDSLIAHGGCPDISSFDVISQTGSYAEVDARYGAGGPGAVVSQRTASFGGVIVGTLLEGFSFGRIADYRPLGVPAYVIHADRILSWLSNVLQDPVGVAPGHRGAELLQNYPNPCNPLTTISFSVPRESDIRLAIYDVAGRLVNVVLQRHVVGGMLYQVEWDGQDRRGNRVASGVYFYRLEYSGKQLTRKLVLVR